MRMCLYESLDRNALWEIFLLLVSFEMLRSFYSFLRLFVRFVDKYPSFRILLRNATVQLRLSYYFVLGCACSRRIYSGILSFDKEQYASIICLGRLGTLGLSRHCNFLLPHVSHINRRCDRIMTSNLFFMVPGFIYWRSLNIDIGEDIFMKILLDVLPDENVGRNAL